MKEVKSQEVETTGDIKIVPSANGKGRTVLFKCDFCGMERSMKAHHYFRVKHHYCDVRCMAEHRKTLYAGEGNHQFGLKGHLNSSFKGHETYKKNCKQYDYWVYIPEHPYCNKSGRVKKHRHIVEQNYERFDRSFFECINGMIVLRKDLYVHHIDENHDNNQIENLMVVTRSQHRTIHNKLNAQKRKRL